MTAHVTSHEDDALLDAARMAFLDLGIRRASVGEVAKRAGIDRVTVYRRIGSKDELVTAVVMRDASRLFDSIRLAASVADPSTGDAGRVVAAFVAMMRGLRDNQLLQRVMTLEPDTVLTLLTVNGSPILLAAIDVAAELLRGDGSVAVDEDDVLARAEIVVRLAHSFILTPHAVLDSEDDDAIERVARRFLTPMLTGVPSPDPAPAHP
ncbi:TetR family transcriptional regulator [Knoellia sinensis KCTC 19936]|uniref:TetR family transcriptional regulator n=1 Tax=Knoellia sinensis KCTC 19936 TaxID=1385520 RepID=A0A0A0J926_9MICO|nr:TetR/AcrR family transcriptional regulator [Knoellia sinensis]KGN32111.1 TetR family transcriptional regulator [Knoellia sinensis KCTC 19936]